MKSHAISKYRQLVKDISNSVNELENLHQNELSCQSGCFDCCDNFTVFRVEFDSILDAIKQEQYNELSFNHNLPCGFLQDGLCTIYQHRPLICRTHGLPILYCDDNKKWQVSFCDKNFETTGTYCFNAQNTINIEKLNLQLYLINQDYCLEQGFDPEKRIDLRQLTNKVKLCD